MKGQEMIKFEVDVAFEEDEESFVEVLARLGAEVPEASVRIVRLEGSGGGWPTVEVAMPEELIGKFAAWYSGEEDEELAEALADEAVPG